MRLLCLLLLFCLLPPAIAQETKTIKVRKEHNLSKAVLDNTEGRLMVVDRFGNPRENKILSYKLFVKNGRETRDFQGYSNNLTAEMLTYLNKQKKSVKIFFTEVSALDDNDHMVKLPDIIDTWFPECKRCP